MLLLLLVPALVAASRDNWIVGGVEVEIANYPWQGSWRLTSSHSCGCVLVGDGWALTAAHCGGATGRTTGWGSTDRNDMEVIAIENVFSHPGWEDPDDTTPGAFPNDISVVRLASNPSSPASAIALGRSRLEGTEDATITGWGRTCGLCALPDLLQGADLDVLNDGECETMAGANNYNGDIHVCVHERDGQSKGACNGDSGGPMVSGGELHGITSWGFVGCPTTSPSAYTRVSFFADWVCETSANAIEGC